MARKLDTMKNQVISGPTQYVCFNFQTGGQSFLRVYDPQLSQTHVLGPNPPGASGDVGFLFFQKLTSGPWALMGTSYCLGHVSHPPSITKPPLLGPEPLSFLEAYGGPPNYWGVIIDLTFWGGPPGGVLFTSSG